MQLEELLIKLKSLYKDDDETGMDEDSDIYDYCGGNYDDAYSIGYSHGENGVSKMVKELVEQYERDKGV